jgi:hypothetical protein
MPDVDPLVQSRNLGPRIDALRAEAKAVREQNHELLGAKGAELGTERDRLTRERSGVEQSTQLADRQATHYAGLGEREAQSIPAAEQQIAAAERSGDFAKADELRESIGETRARQAAYEARAQEATREAAQLRERASGLNERVKEVDAEIREVFDRQNRVEQEADKLEQQADVWQQVRHKWSEVAFAGENIPQRAAFELEIDALTAKAQRIVVDRTLIRTVVPDLPDTTPGIDDPPPPLPEAAVDEMATSAAESTTDDMFAWDGSANAVPASDTFDEGFTATTDSSEQYDMADSFEQPAPEFTSTALMTLDEPADF